MFFKKISTLKPYKIIKFNIRKINIDSKTKLSQLGVIFNQKPSLIQQQSKIKSSFNKLLPFISSTSQTSPLKSLTSFSSKNDSKPTGLFGKNELKSHEGFYVLKENAEKRVNELIREGFSSSTSQHRKLVEIFDDISNELCCVADLAEFVRTSHPNINYRQSADMTFASIAQIVEK